jgi:hypothetical protein
MKNATIISVLTLLILPTIASGQDAAKPLPEAPSSQTISAGSRDSTVVRLHLPRGLILSRHEHRR